MYADDHLLLLAKVELKNRDQLPEYSGIYYVVDENNLVWYIGQAQNIQQRWKSKTHHRLFQLVSQKKKNFKIYYRQVATDYLDLEEKIAIAQYHPQLNSTPVKKKSLRPSETFLREIIITLADYLVVIGIEPPRKQEPEFFKYHLRKDEQWWIANKVIDLEIIHLGIDFNKLQNLAGSWEKANKILNKVFKTRKNYDHKWEPYSNNPYLPIYCAARLLVNGFAVEVTTINFDNLKVKKGFLASETINILDTDSVNLLNYRGTKTVMLTFLPEEKTVNNQSKSILKLINSRIRPLTIDPISLIFNEPLDTVSLSKVLNSALRDGYID